MAKNKQISYPYPVLYGTCEDYKKARFETNISVYRDYTVKASCKVINGRDIKQLMTQRKAAFVLEITSPKTWYNQSIRSYDGIFPTLSLPAGEVRDTILLQTYIVAMEEIRGFSSTDFISDYDGMTFTFQPGDIIGVGEQKAVDIVYEEEEVRKGKPIIVFDQGEHNELSVAFDDNEAIHIVVPKNVYERIAVLQQGSKTNQRQILAVLAVPALVQVLQNMVDIGEDQPMAETKWYKTLLKRLQEYYAGSWRTECREQPVRVAEKLLEDVYIDAVTALE